MKKNRVSNASIRRLPRYYRHLEVLQKKGIERISSRALSIRTGLTASQIRQDLSTFGEFGQQGYGYNVGSLKDEIAGLLGMTRGYTAVMVGVGRLGKALLANFPFEKYGVRITALYDINPNIVGTRIFGIPVYHVDELSTHLSAFPADIGILTASVDVAQELANMLAKVGVKGIWNYTNAELKVRFGNPVVEDVHLFDSLFSLCSMISGEYELPDGGMQRA